MGTAPYHRITGRPIEAIEPGAMAALVEGDARHAEPPSGHVFPVEVTEVMLLKIGKPPDHLEMESWTPDRGRRVIERR